VQNVDGNDGIECSVHTLPKPLLREFRHVFGDTYVSSCHNLSCEIIAIPTNQKAREDLVAVGDHIEKEKDRLLHVVRDYSVIDSLCVYLSSQRYHYILVYQLRLGSLS
jgi:hypothetical protein